MTGKEARTCAKQTVGYFHGNMSIRRTTTDFQNFQHVLALLGDRGDQLVESTSDLLSNSCVLWLRLVEAADDVIGQQRFLAGLRSVSAQVLWARWCHSLQQT